MKIILPILLLVSIISCQDPNNENLDGADLIGKWQLTELLMDPGDGSGVFESTDLDITLEFLSDTELVADGVLCGYEKEDTLIEAIFDSEEAMISVDCNGYKLEHGVYLVEGKLVLNNRSCREPCSAKFEKI